MPLSPERRLRGLTIVEVLTVISAVAVVLAVAVPVVAGGKKQSGLAVSMNNLVTHGVASVLYAMDWAGRQVTWAADDLGAFGGNPGAYPNHPPMPAGTACDGITWAYFANQSNNALFQPIIFPGGPGGSNTYGWGAFRPTNVKPFHDYLGARYQDPIFYAPNDTVLLSVYGHCLDLPCEFNPFPSECNPAWSSYARSPAAMFHPDVMRANADGGFQAPWTLDHGYDMPGLFQAAYPELKTMMLEHSWLQNGPADPCNPAFFGCEPWYFNMGLASSPATLFYDTSVRLLPNTEALAADQSVLMGTGGVDGLWHRGTPFGEDGYFLGESYDTSELSHHILTTDGMLGRDTLADMQLVHAAPPRARARAVAAPHAAPGPGAAPGQAINPYGEPIRFTRSQTAQ